MALTTDFIYDGVKLSDLGYIVARFGEANEGEITTDSQFSFNNISLFNGKYQPFIKSEYEDKLEMEFWIARNGCEDGVYNITISQLAYLKRWLSRPTPHKLTIPTSDYEGIYWVGSFNVEEYVFGDERIGAHLTFECDAPFGYYEFAPMTGSLVADEQFVFNDISDEIGYLYPDMEITVKDDGDLIITDGNGRETRVNNCSTNEVLTFTNLMGITSSSSEHKIGDDFNYVFYRISNTFGNRENTFTSNLPIDYIITYKPIAKVVIV